MNFGKGGQNIVQAGSNNPNVFKGAGNFAAEYFGRKLRLDERAYNRQADEESRMRINDANHMSKAKANVMEQHIKNTLAPVSWGQMHDFANMTHEQHFKENGEYHPSYVEGTTDKSSLVRPVLAAHLARYGVRPSNQGPIVGAPPAGEFYNPGGNNQKAKSAEPEEDMSGTVARFHTDDAGNVTTSRQKLTEEDIDYKRHKSQTPPDSMRNFDDSDRPSNRTWTPEQKASLENERPRTGNLNTGINDGKGGNN
jgi:hypothetical protein